MQLDLPLHAEKRGFTSIRIAEGCGSDAITPVAFIGARTNRIRPATSITQLAARAPANLAMATQTIA
ncbi:LLM class flavin-dependent oxidoreductase [uncultured Novosphingobium sp.]|uniref:LLM class flavin-dependent oxidoreductase n=1 Tax=uncultured Novosphingobium sp. TaxID=292277 RepID=UPI0037478B91